MCHFVGNFFLFHHQMKLISLLFTCSLKIFIHSLRSSTLFTPRQQADDTAINVVFYLQHDMHVMRSNQPHKFDFAVNHFSAMLLYYFNFLQIIEGILFDLLKSCNYITT